MKTWIFDEDSSLDFSIESDDSEMITWERDVNHCPKLEGHSFYVKVIVTTKGKELKNYMIETFNITGEK